MAVPARIEDAALHRVHSGAHVVVDAAPGDGVVHCKSRAQAELVLRRIGERLRECGLELHPDKTHIVYCQDVNRRETHPVVQFTFLGYTFRPRKAVDKYGRVYVNFAPAVNHAIEEGARRRFV